MCEWMELHLIRRSAIPFSLTFLRALAATSQCRALQWRKCSVRQRTQRPRLVRAIGAQPECDHQINRASGISVAEFNRINHTQIIPIARWTYRSYDYHRIARRACQPRGHHITLSYYPHDLHINHAHNSRINRAMAISNPRLPYQPRGHRMNRTIMISAIISK